MREKGYLCRGVEEMVTNSVNLLVNKGFCDTSQISQTQKLHHAFHWKTIPDTHYILINLFLELGISCLVFTSYSWYKMPRKRSSFQVKSCRENRKRKKLF